MEVHQGVVLLHIPVQCQDEVPGEKDRHTDGQIDRRTGRQTDRQMVGKIDG